MTWSFRSVLLAAGALLAGGAMACSSPSSAGESTGSCTVSGSLLGAPLTVRDCASATSTTAGRFVTDIAITDFGGACGILMSNALRANSKVLDLHFNSSSALALGTYNVGSSGFDAQFATYGPTCDSPSGESAGGGNVVVTRLTPTIDGTFDLSFGADHVTGGFSVPNCSPGSTPGPTACM